MGRTTRLLSSIGRSVTPSTVPVHQHAIIHKIALVQPFASNTPSQLIPVDHNAALTSLIVHLAIKYARCIDRPCAICFSPGFLAHVDNALASLYAVGLCHSVNGMLCMSLGHWFQGTGSDHDPDLEKSQPTNRSTASHLPIVARLASPRGVFCLRP